MNCSTSVQTALSINFTNLKTQTWDAVMGRLNSHKCHFLSYASYQTFVFAGHELIKNWIIRVGKQSWLTSMMIIQQQSPVKYWHLHIILKLYPLETVFTEVKHIDIRFDIHATMMTVKEDRKANRLCLTSFSTYGQI